MTQNRRLPSPEQIARREQYRLDDLKKLCYILQILEQTTFNKEDFQNIGKLIQGISRDNFSDADIIRHTYAFSDKYPHGIDFEIFETITTLIHADTSFIDATLDTFKEELPKLKQKIINILYSELHKIEQPRVAHEALNNIFHDTNISVGNLIQNIHNDSISYGDMEKTKSKIVTQYTSVAINIILDQAKLGFEKLSFLNLTDRYYFARSLTIIAELVKNIKKLNVNNHFITLLQPIAKIREQLIKNNVRLREIPREQMTGWEEQFKSFFNALEQYKQDDASTHKHLESSANNLQLLYKNKETKKSQKTDESSVKLETYLTAIENEIDFINKISQLLCNEHQKLYILQHALCVIGQSMIEVREMKDIKSTIDKYFSKNLSTTRSTSVYLRSKKLAHNIIAEGTDSVSLFNHFNNDISPSLLDIDALMMAIKYHHNPNYNIKIALRTASALQRLGLFDLSISHLETSLTILEKDPSLAYEDDFSSIPWQIGSDKRTLIDHFALLTGVSYVEFRIRLNLAHDYLLTGQSTKCRDLLETFLTKITLDNKENFSDIMHDCIASIHFCLITAYRNLANLNKSLEHADRGLFHAQSEGLKKLISESKQLSLELHTKEQDKTNIHAQNIANLNNINETHEKYLDQLLLYVDSSQNFEEANNYAQQAEDYINRNSAILKTKHGDKHELLKVRLLNLQIKIIDVHNKIPMSLIEIHQLGGKLCKLYSDLPHNLQNNPICIHAFTRLSKVIAEITNLIAEQCTSSTTPIENNWWQLIGNCYLAVSGHPESKKTADGDKTYYHLVTKNLLIVNQNVAIVNKNLDFAVKALGIMQDENMHDSEIYAKLANGFGELILKSHEILAATFNTFTQELIKSTYKHAVIAFIPGILVQDKHIRALSTIFNICSHLTERLENDFYKDTTLMLRIFLQHCATEEQIKKYCPDIEKIDLSSIRQNISANSSYTENIQHLFQELHKKHFANDQQSHNQTKATHSFAGRVSDNRQRNIRITER